MKQIWGQATVICLYSAGETMEFICKKGQPYKIHDAHIYGTDGMFFWRFSLLLKPLKL